MQEAMHGCRIEYEIMENASDQAPRVLMLHGWGCDHRIFAPFADTLKDAATLITLDFPGHGQSEEPPEPWGVSDYAEQVYAFLTLHKLMPVHVVAHSFGGRVALKLAALHPEAVGKLVLTGCAGVKKPETAEARKRTDRYKRYTAFLNHMKATPALAGMAEKLQTTLRNRYGSADYVKLDERMRKSFVKIVSEDLSPLLCRVQAPTLLIWGDADTETPLWMGRKMEKEIPDAGLAVFEGGTHFAFLEQPRRFTVIVKEFFREEHA